MKKLVMILVMVLGSIGLVAALDPVEGFWKSIDEKSGEVTAFWKIYERGGKLFGEIVRVPNQAPGEIASKVRASYRDFPVAGAVNRMRVTGTPWIYNLTRRAEGRWEGGTIIDPASGDSYACKITFRPADGRRYPVDTLEMRGEIGLGIGRSQFWVKATEAETK